jgi:ParB family chromosome partitioning protein
LDNGDIAFMPAVTLSFLQEAQQIRLDRCMELNGFRVDMKKADILRQYSDDGKLDDDSIYRILSGEIGRKPQPNRTPTVKVNKAVYAKYFRPDQPAREVQEIVEKALVLYFQQ